MAFTIHCPISFLSCSEDNQTPESPADADDNFITSVVMTVASQSYTAEIIDNIITITVPYTVSLNNAQVEFKYTSSATIIPDPASITDWDTERTFRVTSTMEKRMIIHIKSLKTRFAMKGMWN